MKRKNNHHYHHQKALNCINFVVSVLEWLKYKKKTKIQIILKRNY